MRIDLCQIYCKLFTKPIMNVVLLLLEDQKAISVVLEVLEETVNGCYFC